MGKKKTKYLSYLFTKAKPKRRERCKVEVDNCHLVTFKKSITSKDTAYQWRRIYVRENKSNEMSNTQNKILINKRYNFENV